MAPKSSTRVNVRSAYVGERIRKFAGKTGATVTDVVGDGLRGYQPNEETLSEGHPVR